MKRHVIAPLLLSVALLVVTSCQGPSERGPDCDLAADSSDVIDLTLLVADHLPGVWPVGMQQFALASKSKIGPGGYNRDVVFIDEHTGTQWDAPAHFIPPPGSGLPDAGPSGQLTADKVPVDQFVGEACVLDVTEHVDAGAPGASFLITKKMVQDWEAEHRALRRGDVLLFHSGYSDRYYKAMPEGKRFVHEPLAGTAPAWPAPTPECLEYVASLGVRAAGIDGTSMGPLPDLGRATHVAGEKHGMIWTECATRLGELPTTGACYVLLAPKYVGGSGGEARALAIVEEELAARLIESAREGRVADLSVVLDDNLPVTWPGVTVGSEGGIFQKTTLHSFGSPRGPYLAHAHAQDTQVGTHLVPPSFSLPSPGFDNSDYSDEIREQLEGYEDRFGERGYSDCTTEAIGLERLMGPARVIDVRGLEGTTGAAAWPGSPVITLERVQEYEKSVGEIQAGEVVIFRSDYTDKYFQPFPEGDRLLTAPLKGTAEGWPAASPEVLDYLASKGVRCVATDGPTIGGADPSHALRTYWAAGSRDLCVVEFLTGLAQIPAQGAYFIFAPVKIAGAHGGYGRAIALY